MSTEPTYVTGWEGTMLIDGEHMKVGGYAYTEEPLPALGKVMADLFSTLKNFEDTRILKITLFVRPNRKGWRLLSRAEGLSPLESLDHNG